MSVHLIQFGRDGKKYMVPVRKQADYKIIRDSERNKRAEKKDMVQFNYLPSKSRQLAERRNPTEQQRGHGRGFRPQVA